MKPEDRKHLEYASGFLDLKMFDDALRETDLVLAVHPEQPQAIAIKSAVLWHMNRLNEAEPFVAKLAEMNPGDSDIWINLAYIRRRTKSVDAAVEALQRAFKADPRSALAHFNMACYRAAQNRSHEALQLLRHALQLDPKLKKLAVAEPDFKNLRSVPAFCELVNGACKTKH